MGAGSVRDAVAGLHDGVHGGVDTDREAGQGDVVVDRGRYPHHTHRPVTRFVGVAQGKSAREGAIAPDHDQRLHSGFGEHAAGSGPCSRFVELEAPCRLQAGATHPQDVHDVLGAQRFELTRHQPAVAVTYRHRFVPEGDGDQRHRTHGGIHPGCITSAGQDRYSHRISSWPDERTGQAARSGVSGPVRARSACSGRVGGSRRGSPADASIRC